MPEPDQPPTATAGGFSLDGWACQPPASDTGQHDPVKRQPQMPATATFDKAANVAVGMENRGHQTEAVAGPPSGQQRLCFGTRLIAAVSRCVGPRRNVTAQPAETITPPQERLDQHSLCHRHPDCRQELRRRRPLVPARTDHRASQAHSPVWRKTGLPRLPPPHQAAQASSLPHKE